MKQHDIENMKDDIVNAFENDEFKTSHDAELEKQLAREAADRFQKRDARINIRLSSTILNMLRRKAAEEGLPYQTFISSILHKYATGRLKNND